MSSTVLYHLIVLLLTYRTSRNNFSVTNRIFTPTRTSCTGKVLSINIQPVRISLTRHMDRLTNEQADGHIVLRKLCNESSMLISSDITTCMDIGVQA